MPRLLVINGRFLTQRLTGVQRYAYETIRVLDKLLKDAPFAVELLVPVSEPILDCYDVSFHNIKLVRVGKAKGLLWVQISFPLYVIKHKALALSHSSIPILTPHIVSIHDMNVFIRPELFSKAFVFYYKTMYRIASQISKKIITVSNFSKEQIVIYCKVKSEKISIIPNGWQHFERIKADDCALAKYALEKDKYFFSLGSVSKNKNTRWVYETAKRNPNYIFAISGNINSKIFGESNDVIESVKNVKYLGYVSDEEAKALMENCKAFIFPSYLEGFGIPPVEALSVRARVISSNTTSLPEVLGKSVHYIEPDKYEYDLEKMMKEDVENPESCLEKFSWEKSTEMLYDLLSNVMRGITKNENTFYKFKS